MFHLFRASIVVAACVVFATGCGITVLGSDDGPKEASFVADGNRLIMTGVITDDTLGELDDAIDDHPDANTIVMRDVVGATDPEINIALGRDVRRRGLSTYVPTAGRVAPGATDVLIGGVHRIAERGASVGVHSWGDEDDPATDLPISDEAHAPFLAFYREMGVPEEFYWFSLRAAKPDAIHWMSEVDLFRFRVVKELR